MKCVSCGGHIEQERPYVFKSGAFWNVYPVDRRSGIYRCRVCGLVQADVSIIDEDRLTHYYARHYRRTAKIALNSSEAREGYYRARGTALTNLAKQWCPTPQNAFELGSGHGFNLKALSYAFPQIRLFTDEIDETLTIDASVTCQQLDNGSYDIILLSHVLEHFTDPVALMQKASAALNPGGVIVIEVPNEVDNVVAFNGSDEPHLTFFTAETLRPLLQRIPGLVVQDIFACGPSYRLKSVRAGMHQLIKDAVKRTPILKQVLAAQRAAKSTSLDFGNRNPRGMFLRAVLTKSA